MNRYVPNEATCPVELDMLGLLLRSPKSHVSEIVDALSEMQCAELAAFCFQRSHMREIGMLIAARCSERALRLADGSIGEMLFEQSRAETSNAKVGLSRITLARAA